MDMRTIPITEELRIKSIERMNRVLEFQKPIVAIVTYQDGTCEIRHDELDVIGYGLTRHEALDSFYDQVILTWLGIAEEDNEALTTDAIELKNRYISLVSNFRESGLMPSP